MWKKVAQLVQVDQHEENWREVEVLLQEGLEVYREAIQLLINEIQVDKEEQEEGLESSWILSILFLGGGWATQHKNWKLPPPSKVYHIKTIDYISRRG